MKMKNTLISPNIEVIAFDIYGVILATMDEKDPRKGIIKILDKCKSSHLISCTCSDAETKHVMNSLKKAGINPNYFDNFFQMSREGRDFNKNPKDFNPILEHYKLVERPNKLLVIGDRKERDIDPAIKLGCQAIHVPMYYKKDSNTDINEYVRFRE